MMSHDPLPPPPWRALAKRLARGVLARGPWYALARARALRGGALTILMYHTLGRDDEPCDAWTVVRRGDFLRQVEVLRRHYEVVSLDQALSAGTARARPQVVLTFDDGDAGLHEHLLPLLEREQLPVTVYVATGQIESGRPYWFDRAMNAMQVAAPARLDLGDFGLGGWSLSAQAGALSWQGIGAVLAALKTLDPARREAATARIEAALAALPKRRVTPLAPLTRAQLRELAASRWVTIGAHTHDHSLLDQIALAQARASIEQSRRLLREWTGQAVEHFAYPNGNHNAALVAEVERLGFASAMATDKGLWRPGTRRHAMPRVPVGRYDDLDKFKLDLLGGVRAACAPISA